MAKNDSRPPLPSCLGMSGPKKELNGTVQGLVLRGIAGPPGGFDSHGCSGRSACACRNSTAVWNSRILFGLCIIVEIDDMGACASLRGCCCALCLTLFLVVV